MFVIRHALDNVYLVRYTKSFLPDDPTCWTTADDLKSAKKFKTIEAAQKLMNGNNCGFQPARIEEVTR